LLAWLGSGRGELGWGAEDLIVIRTLASIAGRRTAVGDVFMQEIALSPEIIELVGSAAFPVVEALDMPVAREKVALAARPSLEELVQRGDLPPELHPWALNALNACRGVLEGDHQAYASFLRATHELLLLAGLPAPCELAADGQ
jgi:hypothetical protein